MVVAAGCRYHRPSHEHRWGSACIHMNAHESHNISHGCFCCAAVPVVLLCCCAVVLLCCCAVVLLCCCAVVLFPPCFHTPRTPSFRPGEEVWRMGCGQPVAELRDVRDTQEHSGGSTCARLDDFCLERGNTWSMSSRSCELDPAQCG